ncbi:MAG: CvpA family protein [Oscillospiraceae bacterium]|jgi:uncharacterized membrane protein required for colicin V production|nr:CvpA family protein [Oscillospiraceae bacterium]
MPAWILDAALLLLLVLSVIFSVKRGFLRSALRIAAFLLALWGASALSAVAAQPVYEAVFQKNVRQTIAERMEGTLNGSKLLEQARDTIYAMPESMLDLAKFAGIPTDTLTAALPDGKFSSETAAQHIESNVVSPVAVAAVRWVLSAVIFLLLLVVLRLLADLVSKTAKLPIVKQTDHVLGGILGAVKGVLAVALICFLLTLASHLLTGSDAAQPFVSLVENSRLTALFGNLPLRQGL